MIFYDKIAYNMIIDDNPPFTKVRGWRDIYFLRFVENSQIALIMIFQNSPQN